MTHRRRHAAWPTRPRGPAARPSQRAAGLWLAGLVVLLLCAWPIAAPARPATIPVSEITPGMKGYGLTVFRGTIPERFDVEVIDVLHNFRPDQDLILIRTPHPRLEKTGSVAGMSGSPIYLDGRLAGAYAYGWGFGLEPIAGVTPIVNMLQELARPLRPMPVPLTSPLAAASRAEATQEGPAERSMRAARSRHAFAPLRHSLRHRTRPAPAGPVPAKTPLLLGGMTDAVASVLAEELAPLGMEVLQAASGGSPAHSPEDAAYVDGGALAVQLIRGDLQATAVGTVTHVEGRRLIAFGHPMLDGGQVSLPSATARVLHILASSRSSFKIAEAIAPSGALIQDRQSTIVVDRDIRPDAVPLHIEVKGVAGLRRDTWNAEVARHELLTVPLVYSAAASALGSALSDQAPAAFRVESTVWFRGRPPIHTRDAGYTERGVALPGVLLGLRPLRLLSLARDNPFERLDVDRISLTFHVDFGRRATQIVSASVPSQQVDPGRTLPVLVTLRRLDAVPQHRVVELSIPSAWAGEKLQIEVEPGDEVEPILARPRDVDEVLARVTQAFPDRSLVVTIRREARGARLDGHVLHNLPASALHALSGQHDSAHATPFATEQRLVVPMDTVLWGTASLSVEVRKEPR